MTGATGFIGGALARRLIGAGAKVGGVARRRPNDDPGFPIHTIDLADLAACRAVLAGDRPDIVLHTAGYSSAAPDLTHLVPAFRDNLQATVNLLAASAEAGRPRVVMCGSLEEPEPDEPCPTPGSPYAISKWAATQYGRLFHSLYGQPVVIARVFLVYGPGQASPSKLIPSTIGALLRREAPPAPSGERQLDWIFIDDVVNGILACAQATSADGQLVDIGTGVLTSVRAVVETLAELLPGGPAPAFGAQPSRVAQHVRVARVEDTRALVGWNATVSLREGLERTIAWHQSLRPPTAPGRELAG